MIGISSRMGYLRPQSRQTSQVSLTKSSIPALGPLRTSAGQRKISSNSLLTIFFNLQVRQRDSIIPASLRQTSEQGGAQLLQLGIEPRGRNFRGRHDPRV